MSKDQKDLEVKANDLGKELGDEEVKEISGGDSCFCVIGGSGVADASRISIYNHEGNDDECWCVVSGYGDDIKGNMRCLCPVAGGGVDVDK
jgi:cytochrome b involved in lipid metabolism